MDFHLHYLKLFMRTIFILITIITTLCGTLLANPIYSQWLNRKVTVTNKLSTIPALIQALEEQHVPFVYDANHIHINKAKGRYKTFVNQPLKDVLTYTLNGSNISFREVGGYILLENKPVQRSGRLAGKIIDERGNPLAKATIRVTGTNQVVESSVDGAYALNLSEGSYTIQVSYVSYQSQRISDVQIKAGDLTSLNVAMKPMSAQIEEVTITTTYKKASVAGLYAAQKNAATVSDGISAEQIARTPDNDMGQVLKRVTGLTTVDNRSVVVRGMSDRYNQAQLDGVALPSTSQSRRDFAFDIIPTEMVSSVVVNKTATPDMSAEFSGGQVTINTLDIPEKNFTNFQFGTGGNSQTLGKDFNRLGQRGTAEYFGFENKKSRQPEGIQTWQMSSDAISRDVIPLGDKTNPDFINQPLRVVRDGYTYKDLDAIEQSKKMNVDGLRFYKYKGQPNQNVRLSLGRVYDLNNDMRFGFSASGNFRNEQNIVQFNNVRGQLHGINYMDSVGFGKNGAGTSYRFNSSMGAVANLGLQGAGFKVTLKNMYARTYADNFNEAIRLFYNDVGPGERLKEQYQLPESMALQQHQINGEYQMPWGIKGEAMFTLNNIKQRILDERRFRYKETTEINGVLYLQTPNILIPASSANAAESMDSRMWTNVNEQDYHWAASFTKSFQSGDFLTTLIKVGYQGVYKNRDLSLLRMVPSTSSYDQTNPSAKIPNPKIMMNYDEILSGENIGFGANKAFYLAENTGGRIADGKMNNHSAYVMLDQKLWDKLRLVYGARLEYFDLNNRQAELVEKQWGTEALNDPFKTYMLTIGDKQTRILPSINATYSITNNLNFRASFSQTAIRPDFRESGLFAFYSYELNGYISGDQVETTIVDNTDLRFEWYPSPGEIISLTGYYKYLDRPIELIQYQEYQSNYKYTNMESATNLGLELEVRKNFSFLSDKPWLNNLFIYANGTLLKSKVQVMSGYDWLTVDGKTKAERIQLRLESQDRPLLGQSPWLLNLGLGYWGESFGFNATYNHRGYRTNLTALWIGAVEYELAPRLLDFQLYGRFLNKKLEAKLNLANILNDWTQYYRNDQLYNKGRTGGVDRNIGDNRYKKEDGDVILYRKLDGRRYGLSLTYSF